MFFSSFVIAHAILTTIGYVGLIAANLWLLLLWGGHEAEIQIETVRVWRRSAQFFGPLLGIGALLGFWLAAITHVPLVSPWLIAAYALFVVALGTQAAIMVPWQLRANRSLARGESVSARPVIVVIVVLSLTYGSVLSLMLLRPA